MTKIDAITRDLSQAPYFALSPRKIAQLRQEQPVRVETPEAESKAA